MTLSHSPFSRARESAPIQMFRPPKGRVSGLPHGAWLSGPPEFCNEIGGLYPIIWCGRSLLSSEANPPCIAGVGKGQEPGDVQA